MLCDSNIIIYAADPADTCCRPFVEHEHGAISVVSRIEVLGFPGFARLINEQQARLKDLVAALVELAITESVIEQAIKLRQQQKMTLGDALIAATALVHNLPLVTRNVDDFKHLPALKLINPFEPAPPATTARP